MMVLSVNVYVKEENLAEFIEATRKNHRGSIQEPGIRRFDVLQSQKDPADFMLYEVYDSEDSWKAHKETPHYKEWRETVTDWMSKPRKGCGYNVVEPADEEMW